MDLDIKEVGFTFLVGAFTILSLELILFHFFNVQITGFFQGKLGFSREESSKNPRRIRGEADDDKSEQVPAIEAKDHPMTAAVFIGFAFSLGILMEDVSYKYVDTIQSPIQIITSAFSAEDLSKTPGIPSKDDLRVKTLIEDLDGQPKPIPLAKDLARSGAFLLVDPNGQVIQTWINSPQPCRPSDKPTASCPPVKDIVGPIVSLYYYAKNRVYEKDNYYDEMKKIQARSDFARSISLIAFLYLMLGFFIGMPVFLILRKLKRLPAQRTHSHMLIRMPAVLFVLSVIFLFSLWAYERESLEFNKRAFGYFSSMLITESRETKSLTSNRKNRRFKSNRAWLLRQTSLFVLTTPDTCIRLVALMRSHTRSAARMESEVADLSTQS